MVKLLETVYLTFRWLNLRRRLLRLPLLPNHQVQAHLKLLQIAHLIHRGRGSNMEPQANKPNQKPTNGYGKRPLWQWIVLYIIIGAVVYSLIYLLFFRHSTMSGGKFTY